MTYYMDNTDAPASTSMKDYFAFSTYETKLDSCELNYKPEYSLVGVKRNNEGEALAGITSSDKYCVLTKLIHNPDIFPTTINDMFNIKDMGKVINASGLELTIPKVGDYYMINGKAIYLTENNSTSEDEGPKVELNGDNIHLTRESTDSVWTYQNDSETINVMIRDAGGTPWINKGFSIAASPYLSRELPNVYGLNIFDAGGVLGNLHNNLTFTYNGNKFKVITVLESSTTSIPPSFYTFMRDLCCSTGSITSAKLAIESGSNISDLIDDSGMTEETITTIDPKNNINLLYDTYFYDILNNLIFNKNNFTLGTNFGNPKLSLEFGFDLIPVTSSTVFTNTENFLDVIEQPNFNIDNTTIKMPNILNYNKRKIELTNDNYKLNSYKSQTSYVDDYYYNFTIDEDLWKKLGFNPCLININTNSLINFDLNEDIDATLDENRINPAYLIKGKYYSEQIYTGPIIAPRRYLITDKREVESDLIKQYKIKTYEINAGDDIKNIDESVLNTYFLKNNHFAENMINLTIPTNVDVKITQNMDVEKYLNSNEIIDSLASVGSYGVIRPNEPAYDSIQQSITINSTINIPDNSSMFVFLTSPNQRYPIISSEATLNVEYIG